MREEKTTRTSIAEAEYSKLLGNERKQNTNKVKTKWIGYNFVCSKCQFFKMLPGHFLM